MVFMKNLLSTLEQRLANLPVAVSVQLPSGERIGAADSAVALIFRSPKALAALMAFLHKDLGVERCRANIDTRNVASQRLVERLGFVLVSRIEAADEFKGEISDEVVYEWEPQPPR